MTLTKTWIGSALAASTLLLAGCGGSGNSSGLRGTGGDFQLLRVTPPNNSILFLNDAIQFDFSTNVDLTTADFNSVAVTAFDLTGQALGEQPRGTFRLAAPPGDETVGRRLELVPLLPTDDLFSNGGFKPGRRYVVQLVGGDRRNGAVLKDTNGKGLVIAQSFSFTTVDGTTPGQLFRNTKPGGPRRAGFEVRPSVAGPNGVRVVDLSANSAAPVEVRLTFDQPINPQAANARGRVYLEYDDPSVGGDNTRIPADIEVESNSLEGAVVVLRPHGVLPNNAVIDVRVLNTLEDMSGESNVSDAAYTDLFAQFVVEPRHQPQFDALVERFQGFGEVDVAAPFVEPVAELGDGYVRASLAFEGGDTSVDFEPRDLNTVLNTDFTQINLRSGRSVNVSGGLFEFRNVTIPEGYTVVGQGSKPMVWLVTGDMTIAGTLSVNGGAGEAVTSTGADVPAAGGIGQCGGGDGGRGSVNTTGRTQRAETGFGPGGVTNGGGQGGQHSCEHQQPNGCRIGSGGGGGAFVTKGDPDFYTRFVGNNTTDIDMRLGDGRAGCVNKPPTNLGVAPGSAGPVALIDADVNNDFWGSGLRISTDDVTTTRPTRRVTGELAAPQGGAGGGGGGDGATDCGNATNWRSDTKGGGGGGGAGVLIIKCLGKVKILSRGRITANGGYGGGGAPGGTSSAPSSTTAAGGGGGAGSGGMVVIMCSELNLVKHGETYARASTTARGNGAYDFAIMADGGVGVRRPGTLIMPIRGKYPTEYQAGDQPEQVGRWHGDVSDQPVGGFGGNGVVQIMTPTRRSAANPEGDADQSGAYFDDSIVLFDTDANLAANPPIPSSVPDKVLYLGWRGYRRNNGTQMNDRGGVITVTNTGLGDIKPAPILLPVPFGPVSRVQSGLVDLGRVDRIGANVAQGVRTVQEQGTATGDPFTNLMAGPTYLFDGTSSASTSAYRGYLNYDGEGQVTFPVVAGSQSQVAGVDANATYNQRAAYAVNLTAANAVLAQIPGRYTGYLARLFGSNGGTLAEFRIVGHDGNRLYLDARQGALPSAQVVSLEVVAKFVAVDTNGVPGLGPVQRGATNAPGANLRVGFAFYAGPTNSLTRYPAQGFEYGLNVNDPELLRTLRSGRYRYVQYDVLFNTQFSPTADNNLDTTRRLTPTTPRPVLRELVLPFQF